MGLYEKLGIDDAMTAEEMQDLLEREQQYWNDVRSSASDTRSHFYNDPVRKQNEEESAFMLHGISVLSGLLRQIRGVVRQPALPVRTVCCAVDSGLSDLGGFADSVVFVCTKRIFKSDYHTILEFLESIHEKDLEEDWRNFARYHERLPEQGTDEKGNRPTRSSRHTGNSREGSGAGSSRKRVGETILVSIIVVLAVVVIGGAYVIYRANQDERSAEEAADAALSGLSGSTVTADSSAGSSADSSGSAAGSSGGAADSSAESSEGAAADSGEGGSAASSGTTDAETENGTAGAKESGTGETAEEASAAASTAEEPDAAALLAGIADYTITSDEEAFPSLTEVDCTGASATSVLVGASGTVYDADKMVDGDLQTSWQEGEDDDGIGQSVSFTFEDGTELSVIALWTGSHGREGSYQRNNRPEDITLSVTYDGESAQQEMTLEDVDGEQMILFDHPLAADSLTITIDSVYKGTDYNDTAISEIVFYSEVE